MKLEPIEITLRVTVAREDDSPMSTLDESGWSAFGRTKEDAAMEFLNACIAYNRKQQRSEL